MKDPIETLRLYIEGRTPGGLYPLEEAMVALAELERRAVIEERRDAWLLKDPYLNECTAYLNGAGEYFIVKLHNCDRELEWYGEGPDYHTALEAALDEAGAR